MSVRSRPWRRFFGSMSRLIHRWRRIKWKWWYSSNSGLVGGSGAEGCMPHLYKAFAAWLQSLAWLGIVQIDLPQEVFRPCSRAKLKRRKWSSKLRKLNLGPSSASLKIRPIALRGLEKMSPVFYSNRRASSDRVCVGAEMESSWTDSSSAWGDRAARLYAFAWAKWSAGEWGSGAGKAWTASSTLLNLKWVAFSRGKRTQRTFQIPLEWYSIVKYDPLFQWRTQHQSKIRLSKL